MRAVATHSGCLSRSSTHTFVTGNGCRFLSRGGKSLPQRRATTSSDQRRGDLGVEPHKHVQVIVHNGKSPDGNRKDLSKFLQPLVDPDPAVIGSFPEQKCSAHAASDAMVPPSYGGIDEVWRAMAMS